MPASGTVPVERAAACREPRDGQEEVGRLRRIICSRDRLAFTLGCKETRVAALPSVELLIEKVAPSGVVLQRREMGIDTGDEAGRAASCGAGNLARNALPPSIQCHCMTPSRLLDWGR